MREGSEFELPVPVSKLSDDSIMLEFAAARRIDDLGCIETGKLADLLLVDGDPLDDLSILADRARIHLVIQGGTIVADRRP
jgi:imidazolonepropionase-like amidohydrolase